MDTVLEILKPQPVTITIYDTPYEVRRIRYPAMLRIVSLVASVVGKTGVIEQIRNGQRITVPDILEGVVSCSDDLGVLCKLVVEESLPDFQDSENLSVEDMLSLLQTLWTVNRLDQAFERFFGQTGMTPQAVPVTGTSGTTS